MSWIKAWSVITVSALFAIKGGDLLIGYLAPEAMFPIKNRGIARSIILKENAPNFKAKFIPTTAYLNQTDSLKKQPYIFETDANGFVKNGNNLNFIGENVKTIIFFGGSTTEQLFVPEKSRWQSIIERRLNKIQKSSKIRVLNGGVSGNTSMHSSLNFLAKGVPNNPKFVVLMHNINDYAQLRLSGSYWEAPKDKAIVQNNDNYQKAFDLFRAVKDYTIPNIYQTYKIVRAKLSDSDDLRDIRREETKSLELIEINFRNSLNAFIDLCISWGAEPILMTQFNRINHGDELFKRLYSDQDIDAFIAGYKRLNDVVREISFDRKIDLIDLEKLVPGTREYIFDPVHLNENGSKLVADILTDYWIKKLGY